jgi:DNA processing protein
MTTGANIRDLLKLSSVQRIGSHKIRALISHFHDAAAVLRAPARDLIRVPGIDRKLASNIIHHHGDAFADDQLKRINRLGARVLTIWDKEYPELLRSIYDPPVLLYVLGALTTADGRTIALVGTRHPSPYGQKIADAFSRELAQLNITTVSGLARGIDTVVHAATLKAGGRTIAVIGSGLDVPYPPENRRLLGQIAEAGAVISEFPMGTKPDATNFPRRNRIISGLSAGTIIIESAEDGGAMITASTALDQNREVFAVPGSILDQKSRGPNNLISQGHAKLVQSLDDVFCELGEKFELRPRTRQREVATVQLSLFEQRIFELLSAEPQHIDAIADNAASAVSETLVTLLSLEFKGIARQLPGKFFLRA